MGGVWLAADAPFVVDRHKTKHYVDHNIWGAYQHSAQGSAVWVKVNGVQFSEISFQQMLALLEKMGKKSI